MIQLSLWDWKLGRLQRAARGHPMLFGKRLRAEMLQLLRMEIGQ